MNFQKLLFICGLEQSRRDLLQMILPIGEKIIFYFEKSHEDSYKNEIVNNTWHINRKDFEVKPR